VSGTFRSEIDSNVTDPETYSETKNSIIIESEYDLGVYSKEVLAILIKNDIPPTPNNFSIYFDKLLKKKSQTLRDHIISILEFEENTKDEESVLAEQSLKEGFLLMKNILSATANLYKNIFFMTKILTKRKQELEECSNIQETKSVLLSLESDISKLTVILKKRGSSIKSVYNNSIEILKNIQSNTKFHDKYGIYNKRYLITKIEQEIELVRKFKYKSSLIMVEAIYELGDVNNDKAVVLLRKTVARLLFKTSKRNDIVAYYENDLFVMLLKHTDTEAAKQASKRICDLVSNSSFLLADREIKLKISIGITDITENNSVEEVVSSAKSGIKKVYENPDLDFAVLLRNS
jgi:diguanylate cyclase (GGDEF)-like protein